jgi:acetyl esterase/lipase
MQPTTEHWKFVDTIAQRTRAEVIMPLYPLTPLHGAEEALAFLEKVYRTTIEKYGAANVTLMGDSCGGGIAASFAEHLPTLGLEQPARLILISPLVDVTMRNPDILAYEGSDPMLGAQGLQKLGLTWAKGLDPNDYRVSPVNGEVRTLRNVMVFIGTREILYPDARLFYDRVNATGVHAELYVGRGLNHAYPLFPIPEARWAIDRIVEAICTD